MLADVVGDVFQKVVTDGFGDGDLSDAGPRFGRAEYDSPAWQLDDRACDPDARPIEGDVRAPKGGHLAPAHRAERGQEHQQPIAIRDLSRDLETWAMLTTGRSSGLSRSAPRTMHGLRGRILSSFTAVFIAALNRR